jgi:hypothetical protein
MGTVEEEYERFIRYHLEQRSGERRGRLERANLHAERRFAETVWWPMEGSFQGLHPEYEVMDWRGRSYFGDYAYFCGPYKFMIEIKGYAVHVRDMDRKKYCDELNRELFLQTLGYRVMSFAYDDVAERPELCMNMLQMLLNRYRPSPSPAAPLVLAEKEVYRLSLQLTRPIRPIDVERQLGINHRTAVKYLHILVEKGWLQPVTRTTEGEAHRVLRYIPVHGVWDGLD